MTDLRTAAQQALDALKAAHYNLIDAGVLDQSLLNKNFTAHDALRDALAQPERTTPAQLAKMIERGDKVRLDERLAEPVPHCEAGPEYCWQCLEEIKPTYGSEEIRKLRDVIANLSPQPARAWVELSDEDKAEIERQAGITDDDDGYIVAQLFRLTEAKLKEKNGIRHDDTALLRQALEALTCSGEDDDPGHRCSHCDDYVDRNGTLRAKLKERLK